MYLPLRVPGDLDRALRRERQRRVRVRACGDRLERWSDRPSCWRTSRCIYTVCTIVALFFLVRLRVGLSYSPQQSGADADDLRAGRAAASSPAALSSRWRSRGCRRTSTRCMPSDLIGAAGGCLILIPLLDRLGAPGVVLTAAALSAAAAVAVRAGRDGRSRDRRRSARRDSAVVPSPASCPACAVFDVVDTKGHLRRPRPVQQVEFVLADRRLRTRRTATGRSATPTRARCPTPGSWTSTRLPRRRSSRLKPDLSNAQYLRYELTALAYHLEGDSGLGDSSLLQTA